MNIRVLRREDAPIFHAHRLGALREAPEAFGSTYEEDVLLPLDVVADRIAESTVEPRRVVFGAFDGDTLEYLALRLPAGRGTAHSPG